jgi:RNA binding exosome subunit
MEQLLHDMQCRVFVRPDEDLGAIKAALLEFFPFSLEQEKVKLVVERVQGFDDPVDIFRVHLDKIRLLRLFLGRFVGLLSQQDRQFIIAQKESRLDEDGFFYVRIDKKSWLNGKAVLTDSGDCFHFSFEIAAFPKNREVMLGSVAKIFNGQGAKEDP